MVDDNVIHVVHVFLLIESRSKSKIVSRFTNFNENPIDEFNTTLELKHMLGKTFLLLLIQPLNLITNHFINARGDAYNKLAPIPHKSIIHDYIVMFHV
jgi:hypothetical protein